jgi:hypothetical protein
MEIAKDWEVFNARDGFFIQQLPIPKKITDLTAYCFSNSGKKVFVNARSVRFYK